VIYRRAATKATRAPSPLKATAFRLAEDPSVPDGSGGVTEVPLVGIGMESSVVMVVLVTGGTTTVSVVDITVVETSVVEDTGALVVEDADGTGTLKVTPADWQRVPAAAMVASSSAAEQAPWTHGRREVTKPVLLQMQAMSVVGQPVLPKLVMAQERAHGGIESSWAETV